MIIRFSVENYRSIRQRQELTFVAATNLKDSRESIIEIDGISPGLLPVAAIYGANASGKTNILSALHFLRFAVQSSHRDLEPTQRIPRSPFALDDSPSRPSSFEVEFVLRGVRYRYGFTLDSERFLEEWLYAYPNGKQQQWFVRSEVPERSFSFSRSLVGEKNRTIEALTRSNSLYLSAAAQNNHEMLLPVYNFLANDLQFSFSRSTAETEELCSEATHTERVLASLRSADLGITGLRTEPVEFGGEFEKVVSALRDLLPAGLRSDFPGKRIRTLLQHRSDSGTQMELPLSEESEGTIAYFSLLGPILKTVSTGGVLCVDGLDSTLHPLLALEIVRTFADKTRNSTGAQLLFNTHDTTLLNNPVLKLRRDQIWFTEKDSSGATRLYPLTDFRPRRDENLGRGYLQGRYGAVPYLDQTVISEESGV